MKTIIILVHPDSRQSNTQQFLIQSGQALTQVDYLDLYQENTDNLSVFSFQMQAEQERLLSYQRIIFQFPLYWYQAPPLLDQWINATFQTRDENPRFAAELKQRQFGIVVSTGAKESDYLAGGTVGQSLSQLMAPYQALATYYQLDLLPLFPIYQFDHYREIDKMELMYRYACFIETGNYTDPHGYYEFLKTQLFKLTANELDLNPTQQIVFDLWVQSFLDRHDEIEELLSLNKEWL